MILNYKASIKDKLALVKSFSPPKVSNAAQLLGSFYLSRIIKKPVHWGMPASVAIEPTTSCNLRCPECPSGLRSFTRPTGMLDLNFFNKILAEIHLYVAYLIFYFQGEPFLHPQFLEMISSANQRGIYTATSTNAHHLKSEVARKTVESGLKRLIISIDGATQNVYEKYRVGGQLNKVLEGTRNIVEWKRKLRSYSPYLIFQFLVLQHNEHQIQEVLKLAKKIGVDEVRLKTAQVYDFEHGNPLIPLNEKFSRYSKISEGSYVVKNKLLNRCWKLWHSCVITWDGRVVPCCFDKDAHHIMGNLNKTCFRDIWRSEFYKSFREKVFQSRSKIDICSNCSVGANVWGSA